MFGKNPDDIYGNDKTSMLLSLHRMHEQALRESLHDRSQAVEKVKAWTAADRRFDCFQDKDQFVKKFEEAKQCGGKFDIEAPELRGLPPRYLNR
jgi:hypothetical protein